MNRVGPYEVVQELGRGGMGVVYEAIGPSGERCALKMLLEPDRGRPERFQREAEVLRFLGQHRGIVGFRGAGVEGGCPYIVMDFIVGRTLTDAMPKVPRAEALRLLVQVARALHFAHEGGVVHRDVKPANVLIDNYGRALLTDFGVAKCLQADRLTLTGEVVGTPAYMAPEQLEGDVQDVDRRTDVYALGAVLYEVLSGRRPFLGSKVQVAKQVLLDEPPPLPDDVPDDLRELCRACMAKEADRRPATAEEVARALEAHLGRAPAEVEKPIAQSASGRTWAVGVVALAVGLGLGLAAGRGLGADSSPDQRPPSDAAPAPADPSAQTPQAALEAELEASRVAATALGRGLAGSTPATPAQAWSAARHLRRAVALDPAAAAREPRAAVRLVEAANQLLAGVDPTRAADAQLVHEARDCLLAARLLAPTVALGDALTAFGRLRRGPAPEVRRAASPWRGLWGRTGQVFLDAEVVERAVREPVAASALQEVDPAKRETYPIPWGAIIYQLRVEAIGNLEVHDQRLRYRILAELYLERPELTFLRFPLGEELLGLGRTVEGRYLLEGAVRDAPASSRYGNYLLGRYLSEWLRDPFAAEPFLVQAAKRNYMAELFLASALLDQGGAEGRRQANARLDAARRMLGKTLRWHAEKLRAIGPGSERDQVRARFAARRLAALEKGPPWR